MPPMPPANTSSQTIGFFAVIADRREQVEHVRIRGRVDDEIASRHLSNALAADAADSCPVSLMRRTSDLAPGFTARILRETPSTLCSPTLRQSRSLRTRLSRRYRSSSISRKAPTPSRASETAIFEPAEPQPMIATFLPASAS